MLWFGLVSRGGAIYVGYEICLHIPPTLDSAVPSTKTRSKIMFYKTINDSQLSERNINKVFQWSVNYR